MDLSSLQVAQRDHGLGSSDIAAVAGLNPWRGPMDVWMVKTARSSFDGNDRTEWGHDMEPTIAARAAVMLNLGALTPVKETYRSHDHAEILATPDFVLGADTLMEVKNVGLRVMRSWIDGPPPYVVAQCTQQLYVTGLRNCYVAASLAGDPPSVYRVDYDEDFANGLVEIGLEFWRKYVLTLEPPPLDHGDATAEYLRQMFPRNVGSLRPAEDGIDKVLAETRDVWAESKRIEKRLDALKHTLQNYIGDADGIDGADLGCVTWKLEKGRVSHAKLSDHLADRLGLTKKQIAELHEEFRGKPPRTLRLPTQLWAKEIDR